MKLSEFQAGYKALGTEIGKLARADIFNTSPEERAYIRTKLNEMSMAVLQADKICRLLEDAAPVSTSPPDDAVDDTASETTSVKKLQPKGRKKKEPDEASKESLTEEDMAQFGQLAGQERPGAKGE